VEVRDEQKHFLQIYTANNSILSRHSLLQNLTQLIKICYNLLPK